MADLLPCPFCGGDAHVHEDDGTFCVACNNVDCFCLLGEAYDPSAMPDHCFETTDEAVAEWNTRAIQPHHEAEIARRMAEAVEGEREACAALADLGVQCNRELAVCERQGVKRDFLQRASEAEIIARAIRARTTSPSQLRADAEILATALVGRTPDRNTQTPEEVAVTEAIIEAAIERCLPRVRVGRE